MAAATGVAAHERAPTGVYKWAGLVGALCALLLSARVAASPAPAPVKVNALVAVASAGPRDGELAVVERGRCALLGTAPRTRYIRSCGWISWVPGSQWVVYERVTAAPAARSRGYVVEDVATGIAFRLPCAEGGGTKVYDVGVAPGPIVAYGCGGTLTVMRLGARPVRAVYRQIPVLSPPDTAPVAVDRTLTYVAVVTQTGGVQVYRLAEQRRIPGTFLLGGASVQFLAWSLRDDLAIATGSGLGIWHPGRAPRVVREVRNTDLLWWVPDGSYLVALSSHLSNPGAWQVDGDGRAFPLPILGSAPLVAITSNGRYAWHPACKGSRSCQIRAFATGAVAPTGAASPYLSAPEILDVARAADIPVYVPTAVPGAPSVSAWWTTVPNGGPVAMIMFSTPKTTELQLTEGRQSYSYPKGAPEERAVMISHRSAVVSACVKGSFCLEVALPKVFVEMQSFGITEAQLITIGKTLTLVK